MAGGVQSLKRGQIDTAELLFPAEANRRFHQAVPKTLPLIRLIEDEPAQPRALTVGVAVVDEDAADDRVAFSGEPCTVTRRIEAVEELGKLGGDFCLEIQPQVPVFVIIRAVKLGNASQRARHVTCQFNAIDTSSPNDLQKAGDIVLF